MAAKVFSVPQGLEAPEFGDFFAVGHHDSDGYFAACEAHREQVAEWCKQHSGSRSKLVGKTFAFPVADGKAEYMVFRTTPLEVIHLDYGDGYQADNITMRGLRVMDIKQLVGRDERLAEIFGSRS